MSETEVYIIIALSIIPGTLALQLGKELLK